MHKLLNFNVGFHAEKNDISISFFPATVPGAAQLDYAAAHNLAPYYFASNYEEYLWMEDVYWTYRATFTNEAENNHTIPWLIAKGIDHAFEIYLNGKKILSQTGMFTPVEINLQPFIQEQNELKIVIFPIPRRAQMPPGRMQASQTTKPAVSYGWDWHPRLVPSGIWDSCFITYRKDNFIKQSFIDYTLNVEEKRAGIQLEVHTENAYGAKLRWELRNMEEELIAEKDISLTSEKSKFEADIADVMLWWPHDQGTPYLYTSTVQIFDSHQQILDIHTKRIGFRTVELVMNDTAWEAPAEFPKSRSVAPAQMKINGRKIFLKGTNWVNPDIFFGRIDHSVYQKQINLAYEANFNVLRVWGGSIVNKESFYEYCNEKGMLVWQDFPLACNNYEGSPEYLSLLKQEATSILYRLRDHACIALWCGGNELFNSWSGMDDQSHALRLLNALCYKISPSVPFIATTPLMGMGHGHYVFRDEDTGEEVFQLMKRSRMTAYSEFGMPGPSGIETLKECIPEDELFPPKEGTSWEVHHAFNAWNKDTWLCTQTLEHYFGNPESLEELISNGQFLQGEGIKFMYEEARRQKPYCAMALHWCFNEPWPTAANNSIINWPNIPKPAFYEAGKACRPVLISASFEKFQWEEGEIFQAEIWLLNDTYRALQSCTVNVFFECGDLREHLLAWKFPLVGHFENVPGPVARYRLPKLPAKRFKILLEAENFPEYNSEYTLLYKERKAEGEFEEQRLNQ